MLLCTSIPNFIKIGALLIFFSNNFREGLTSPGGENAEILIRMFYIMLLSTQIPNFIKIGVFLIFLCSIFGGVVPPPGGADAEILKHVSIKIKYQISTKSVHF